MHTTRTRHGERTTRGRATIAVLAVSVVMTLTGCTHPATSPGDAVVTRPVATPTPTVTLSPINLPNASTAAGRAKAERVAEALLARAILPPGATKVATLDTRVLTSPPGEIACSPLTLATQRYTLPAGTLHSVVDFVKNHLTPPLVLSQADQGTDQGIADVGVMETTPSTGEVLDYSATLLPSGQIGLRVDAMALAAGYACESSGGGPTILKTHGPVPRATAGTATR